MCIDVQEAAPLVSVIMPAYNAQEYIEKAIRSVINQTVTDLEVLVLDDGSTDATCSIVEALSAQDSRIVLIRNDCNMGVARTRNRGLDCFRGRYVAFLDSDDVWRPEKLEVQLLRMQETGAALVYSSYAIVDEAGVKVSADYLVPEKVSYRELLKENIIGCSTVVLSSEIAKKFRFNPEYYHEDYVLWLQILKDEYAVAGCKEVLVNWRYVENSRSYNKLNSAKKRWNIYRKLLKLSILKSTLLFCGYAWAGMRKYRKIS